MPRKAREILEIKSLARTHAPMAIRSLAHICKQTRAPPAARVMAAKELLDRGYGKSKQPLVGDDDGDGSIQITVRKIIETVAAAVDDEVHDEEGDA